MQNATKFSVLWNLELQELQILTPQPEHGFLKVQKDESHLLGECWRPKERDEKDAGR